MGDMNDPFMRNRDAAVQARTKAQNRANVLQMKLIGQSHSTGLTNNLLKLFEARPPLEYKPPLEKRKPLLYSGMAQFVSNFVEPGDPEYEPPVVKGETPTERRARIQKLRLEKGAAKAAEDLQKYDPNNDPNVTGDPYKTLFVARLNYETTEHQMKREFEAYGPIKRVVMHLAWRSFTPMKVRLITDKETNKPRGYAFIEYMHTRDMKTAYKQADGKKLDNRRVLVDVERGRTVPNWRPRRLGGGLGSTRIGGEDLNQKHSGREQQQVASGAPRRSEEPRAREDRNADRDREKSRDTGRDREREWEKSRERSHERGRDRDTREDRHQHRRDRDRTRDKDKERDRGRDRDRDRTRGRDRERDRGRDYDRERDRDRDRARDKEGERDSGKGYDRASHERDRGYKHEMDVDYDLNEPIHEQERDGARDRELKPGEHDYRMYDDPAKHGHGHSEKYDEPERDRERVKHKKPGYYGDDRYEKMGGGDYQGKVDEGDLDQPEEGEAREHDYGYQRSERSPSRDDR